jgi:hypothetical protein
MEVLEQTPERPALTRLTPSFDDLTRKDTHPNDSVSRVSIKPVSPGCRFGALDGRMSALVAAVISFPIIEPKAAREASADTSASRGGSNTAYNIGGTRRQLLMPLV